METISITIEKNLSQCKILWNLFSPRKIPWESWDVAMCFFNETLYTPYFIVLNINNKIEGILPLWYEINAQRYLFFGGSYMEDISFWFDHRYFNKIFEQIPTPTILFTLNNEVTQNVCATHPSLKKNFFKDEFHYTLSLQKYEYSIETYLQNFSKKHRKNLRYDLAQIEKENIDFNHSKKVEGFDIFIAYNLARFGDESDFQDPYFITSMKKMLHYFESTGELHTITFIKDGKIIGIEYAVLSNDKYYILNGGYDVTFTNVGKGLIMEHLKNAAKHKANVIDFLCGEGGWKELWNFEKEQYFTFKKE